MKMQRDTPATPPKMNPGMTEEVGKVTGTFMGIMKETPLSLALVVMNLALIAFIFYTNSQVLNQRQETTRLMADKITGCVATEIVDKILIPRETIDRMIKKLDDLDAKLSPEKPPQ